MIAGSRSRPKGNHRDRGPRGQRRRGEGARDVRHGLPELCAVPAHDGAEERGVPAQDPPGRPTGERNRLVEETTRMLGSRRCWSESGAALGVSASGWHSPSDRPTAQAFSWTSRCPPRRQLRVQTRASSSSCDDGLGATIVYVTHDQVEAMDDGGPHRHSRPWRAPAGGTPPDVYGAPGEPLRGELHRYPPMNTVAGEVTRVRWDRRRTDPGRACRDSGALGAAVERRAWDVVLAGP